MVCLSRGPAANRVLGRMTDMRAGALPVPFRRQSEYGAHSGPERRMKHSYVKPQKRLRLRDHEAGDTGPYASAEEVESRTEQLKEKLDELQQRLYAEGRRAL